MKIKESLSLIIENKEKEVNYFYRLTESETTRGVAFGIEVEKQDIKNGAVTNIERDAVDIISNKEEKVKQILELLYRNNVSPIHLVDVIGEYVDEYVQDFDNEETLAKCL